MIRDSEVQGEDEMHVRPGGSQHLREVRDYLFGATYRSRSDQMGDPELPCHCLSVLTLCVVAGTISPLEISTFRSAWASEGFSGDARYLSETIALLREVKGRVVECGSGATMILAGVLAERFG
jgi:hypothetical protein